MIFFGFLLLGILAGIIAGLLGLGGGILVVPSLALIFSLQGMGTDLSTHLAIGTSLACMICTSCTAAFAHHFKRSIAWAVFFWMSAGLLIGSWSGSLVSASMNGSVLKMLFGLFLWFVAWRMLRRQKEVIAEKTLRLPIFAVLGLFTGCISGVFGVGGSIITVPVLLYSGLPMHKALGTASACILPVAIAGAVTNIFTGLDISGLPEYSTGYIYWPAFVGIVLGSVPCTRVGVRLAYRLPAERLRKIFAVLLIIVGCELILKE